MSRPISDKLTYYMLKNVNRAIREFEMIANGDRIAVAVSGGKDSRALLHLLRARQPSVPEEYHLLALHVEADSVGQPRLRPVLEPWFRELGVEYAFLALDLAPDEPQPLDCFRCSWNRRKALFRKASELGCNKLAFGITPTMPCIPHCSTSSIPAGWRPWLLACRSSTARSPSSVL